jgi:uncharacterized protein (TIGR03067 family)
MRRLVIAATIFLLACTATAQQPGPKKNSDPELIQGTWWIVGLESGGKAQSDKGFKGNSFTFSKGKAVNTAVLLERAYPKVEFTYSLDPGKSPKEINLTTKGNKALGIYKLDGDDDLTICVSLGGSRPGEFATRPGGDTETFTLRRNRWERYTEKGLGFSIEFPGKPVESTREVKLRGRRIDSRVFTVQSELERASYSVTVTPLESKNAREADEALDAAQKAMLADLDEQADAKLDSERKILKPPAGMMEARELTIAMRRPKSKDAGAMRVRLYASSERLYSLVVSGTDEVTKSPNVSWFWGSFRIPGEKRNSPPNRERGREW